ncbi:AEC family transporter [Kocuria sp. cx-455]|uniref:AEC family transporter n=1 Tax=Kocuria sp. cx-455 TaxID=2771377 RepID=UPI001684BB5C|nr:AEC family transporter [Kocuria sp. cx-455]MBD2764072.1 AEC family transporter [Kocuria sp. cx-455]
MSGVFSGFFIIWAVIGVGFLVGRSGFLGPHGQVVLSKLAFYVASPPLLFLTISQADIAQILSTPLLIAMLSAWLTMGLYAGVSRFALKRDAATVVLGSQAAGQVNAANLGIPIAMFVLGDASQVAPVMLFQLAINSPLYLTAMDTLTDGHRPTPGSILKNTFTNPLIVGSLLGILFGATGWQLPDLVLQPVELVAGASIPAMLLAFGMSLVGSRPLSDKRERMDTLLASAAKLFIHPALALLLGHLLGLVGPALYATVIMASLPTAQNLYVAAVRYNRATTVSRDTVLVTTVFSMVTMAIIAVVLS